MTHDGMAFGDVVGPPDRATGGPTEKCQEPAIKSRVDLMELGWVTMCSFHLSFWWAAARGPTVPVVKRRNPVGFSLTTALSYASSAARSAPS